MTTVAPRPVRISIPDEVLDDLREHLSRTRWPDEVPGSGWQYGSSRDFVRRLVEHWRCGFDWRKQETRLNTVDLPRRDRRHSLHFVHQRGVGPDPLPLLLAHGWPGSIWEFHEPRGGASREGARLHLAFLPLRLHAAFPQMSSDEHRAYEEMSASGGAKKPDTPRSREPSRRRCRTR